IIREKEEAEQIYVAARDRGHVASLMTQQRPNIFTQKVANIEPGHDIDIDITYFNTLRYVDGSYEFVFPMVVGPRFNPPATTDGIAAVPRSGAHTATQATAIEYLAPHERSGHDISLTLTVDAGVDIEDITSSTHAVDTTYDDASSATVVLSAHDTIPNKDFVLRYRVAGERIKSSLMVHRAGDGGYFTMMLYPPAELGYMQRQPMEMIFVLDCSGSMRGQPLALAKAAVERALERLQPEDSFQIIRFSSNASQMGPAPLPATPKNVRKGLRYLAGLDSAGGTMMIEGIKAALDFEHDPERFRIVSFMTDGYIGNEQDILAAVIERVGDARLFSFGVGSSVNRYLLDNMARVGRGAVAYIGLDGNTLAAVDGFYECITYPAMTDLAIDWGDLRVTDVFPRRIPDLFAGRPVVLTGRFSGALNGRVTVEGRAGHDTVVDVIEAEPDDPGSHPGIAAVWARAQIRDLARRGLRTDDPEGVEDQITQLALGHNLMSQYTAFVAVDSLSETAGTHGTTVHVPVPVPAGVRYDTTVGAR
ncbi:MAG: VIT domain-containing protein, partial [Planctomycetota bacterium]